MNWSRIILFIIGGLAAGGGVAYFTGLIDPQGAERPAETAARSVQQPDAAVDDMPDVADADEAEPELAATQAADPAFDLLRVEPDGGLLIAGNAAPDARIELLQGEDVLAETRSDEAGDFVFVLDDPLAAGDHELVLRANGGESDETVSRQTALVSIPDSPDGEVLALVDEPGAASRLITVPEADEGEVGEPALSEDEEIAIAAGPQDEEVLTEADVTAEAETPAEIPATAEAGPGETGDTAELAAQEPADDTAQVAETARTEPAPQPAADDEQQEIAAAPETDAPAPAREPETAPAGTDAAQEQPPAEAEIAQEQPDTEADPQAETAAQEQPEAETEIAAVPQAETAPAAQDAPEAPAAVSGVIVEAVEIEGDMIYVAGRATPGHVVRVYANSILLGDSPIVDGNGSFLVEARQALEVGDYIIRADLLDASGNVLARAAVPFIRAEGEAIAAIAPALAGEARQDEPEAADEPVVQEEAVAAAPEPDVADAPAEAADAQAVDEPETETASAPDEAAQPPATLSETAEAPAAPAPQEATGELAATTPEPAAPDTPAEDIAAAAPQETTPPAGEDVAADTVEDVAPPAGTASSDDAAAEDEVPAVAGQPDAEETVATADQGREDRPGAVEAEADVTAPALQNVDGSVIIRRGDTLWQISRRVYGRGVRYTNIYLANQEQIRNPDRIWPGQVFTVPGRTSEGEAADLETLADRAREDAGGATAR